MKFTKMHGLGNDYVYVNCLKEKIEDPSALSKRISDRHFGIGSDGLILICPSDKADFRMDMYNADGSQAEMCGNGIRCVGKYVYDHGLTDQTEISIETLAGIKYLSLNIENEKVSTVRVNMGSPILQADKIPVLVDSEKAVNVPIQICGRDYRMTCVSMGNPHAVIFMKHVKDLNLEKIGPYFENHPVFPKRTNTEFVEILSSTEINMRVWERGAGETLACGTGTCASVVASVLNGLTEDKVLVHLLGGDLMIEWDRITDQIYMTGPATTVFEGIIF